MFMMDGHYSARRPHTARARQCVLNVMQPHAHSQGQQQIKATLSRPSGLSFYLVLFL